MFHVSLYLKMIIKNRKTNVILYYVDSIIKVLEYLDNVILYYIDSIIKVLD